MAILPPDPIYIFRGDAGPVHSLSFKITPYVEHLYAGIENGNIHIWDLKKNRQSLKLEEKKDPCLSLSANDERLVAQRKGGTIDIWSADGSNWIMDTSVETSYCGFCRFETLEEDLLLVPLRNSVIGAFSLASHEIVYQLDHTGREDGADALGEVMAIKVINCSDNRYVLAAYESGHTALWEPRERRAVDWLKIDDCPMAINFDNYWMRGVIGSPSDKLEIFELSKSRVLGSRRQIAMKNPGTSVIGSRPDAKVFAVGGWDGRLRIFSWKSLRPLVVLEQHKGTIHDVAYATGKIEAYNSNGLMAAAGKDGTISLWDLYNQ